MSDTRKVQEQGPPAKTWAEKQAEARAWFRPHEIAERRRRRRQDGRVLRLERADD